MDETLATHGRERGPRPAHINSVTRHSASIALSAHTVGELHTHFAKEGGGRRSCSRIHSRGGLMSAIRNAENTRFVLYYLYVSAFSVRAAPSCYLLLLMLLLVNAVTWRSADRSLLRHWGAGNLDYNVPPNRCLRRHHAVYSSQAGCSVALTSWRGALFVAWASLTLVSGATAAPSHIPKVSPGRR